MAIKGNVSSRKKSNSKNSKIRRKIESNLFNLLQKLYSGSNIKTLIWLYAVIGIYFIKYHFSYKLPYKRRGNYAHPYDHSFIPRVPPQQIQQQVVSGNQTYTSKHQVDLDDLVGQRSKNNGGQNNVHNSGQNGQNKVFEVKTTQTTTTRKSRAPEIEGGNRKVIITTPQNTQAEFAAKIILNKHDKLFYLHEPLILTQFRTDKKGTDYSKKILEEYFGEACLLPRTEWYLTGDMMNGEKKTTYQDCMKHGICYRFESENLLQPPICPQDAVDKTMQEREVMCPNFSSRIEIAEGTCKGYKGRSMFTHYLGNVQTMPESLLGDENFRLLVLMQDPRAILANEAVKARAQGKDLNYMNAFITCKTTQSMIDKMVLLAADSKFKAQLKIVRYEDLVTYPEQIGLEIFEFLDIPDSDKVIDELKRAAEVNLAQESWKLNHWLWDLKWDDVNRLQTLCPAAFKTLGYTVMDSEDKFQFAVSASHNKMLSFDFFKKNFVVPVGLPTTTPPPPTTTVNETLAKVSDQNQDNNNFSYKNYGAGEENSNSLGDNLGQDIVVVPENVVQGDVSTEF